MSRSSQIFEALVEILRDTHALPSEVLTAETRLHHDLQMNGDDAAAFMSALSERWDVEWAGFDFGRHFLVEVEVSSPSAWLSRRADPEKRKKVPVTLGHLVSVVESGQWKEPSEAAV